MDGGLGANTWMVEMKNWAVKRQSHAPNDEKRAIFNYLPLLH